VVTAARQPRLDTGLPGPPALDARQPQHGSLGAVEVDLLNWDDRQQEAGLAQHVGQDGTRRRADHLAEAIAERLVVEQQRRLALLGQGGKIGPLLGIADVLN